MASSIRVRTQVLPGHRIEISAPELSEGASVDVVVTPNDKPAGAPHAIDRRGMLKLSIEQRRQLLMQQSESLKGHYEAGEDRSGWQGGDIVE